MTDAFDDLDRLTLAHAGDEVVYRPGGGAALDPPIKVWIDHGDAVVGFGNVAANIDDPVIEVRMLDVAVPTKTDLVTLPRMGVGFTPKDWLRTADGRHWRMTLKRAAPVVTS